MSYVTCRCLVHYFRTRVRCNYFRFRSVPGFILSPFEDSPFLTSINLPTFVVMYALVHAYALNVVKLNQPHPLNWKQKSLTIYIMYLQGAQQQAVIDKVTLYRDSLCEDTPLMFGKEIVTCLPDSLKASSYHVCWVLYQ